MSHTHPAGAAVGLRGGKGLLGAWFRGGQAVGFLESSRSPGMSPCALGMMPGKPSSSWHPRKLGRCLSLGWGGAHGDAVRYCSPLNICTASCAPASLWCPGPCPGCSRQGPSGRWVPALQGCSARSGGCQGWAVALGQTPAHWTVWDVWEGPGTLPWGLAGLWSGRCRSCSPGTGRLSPQPRALPRSGFPRQAAHETSLVSNCCAPPFIIIDSASP